MQETPSATEETTSATTDAARASKALKARRRYIPWAILIAALVVFPSFGSQLDINIAVAIVLAIPGALALNLLTGVAGQVSIGNAAFMAVGAMVAAMFGSRWGLPFLAVVPIAGIVAALVGALIGIPALRLRGIYLLVATLALQYIVVFAFQEYQFHTVGAAGFVMATPQFAGISLLTPTSWYFAFLVLAVVFTAAYLNLMRTKIGRAWKAVRDRDIAAAVIGVNVSRAKILAFVVSSFAIGVQGAFYAYYIGVVSYNLFTTDVAISYVAMILVGGLGLASGAIYGAIFVAGLPYLLQQLSYQFNLGGAWLQSHITDVQNAFYGLAIILFLLFEPSGLAGIVNRAKAYVGHRWRRRQSADGQSW